MGSSNPNMQNLPNDVETRACFIAEPGNVMVCADYSAQESIILANFAKDEALIAFYKKGLGSVRISLCDTAEHPAGFAKDAEQKPSPE